MKLVKVESGWKLDTRALTLDVIEIDYRLGLRFSDDGAKLQLWIETPFVWSAKGSDVSIDPNTPSTLAAVLGCIRRTVQNLFISSDGTLCVSFGNDGALMVQPHERFEAWQLSSNDKFMMVCSPGGNVAVFT